MSVWTQRSIHHCRIGGITVIAFGTSFADTFAWFILEGSIFASHWLCCSLLAEVSWSAQISCWGCRALSTWTVIVCSASPCRRRITCSLTVAARRASHAILNSCIPLSVREFSCRTRNWDASTRWAVMSHWTVKLIRHSRAVIAVIPLSAVSLGCGQCCMWTVLAECAWEGTT